MRKQRAHKRLFIAIKPDASAITSLLEAQRKIISAQVRLIPAENLHMTLAFIGNASMKYQQCLKTAAAEVRMQPFPLQLDRYGIFAKRQTLWVGTSVSNAALIELHRRLHRALVSCGFSSKQKFRPHVTLLRKSAIVTIPEDVPAVEFFVDYFLLMQSVFAKDGVRYRSLCEFALKE